MLMAAVPLVVVRFSCGLTGHETLDPRQVIGLAVGFMHGVATLVGFDMERQASDQSSLSRWSRSVMR